jgi:hypothetical protein
MYHQWSPWREPHVRGPVRRPSGRVAGRTPAWMLVAGMMATAGVVVWFTLGAVVLALAFESPGPLLVGTALFVLLRHRRHRRRARFGAAGTAPLPRHPAPPPRPDLGWARARDRFVELRSEYAAYECDPMAVLRLPALSDVTVPSTGRFVEAFAEAQALETDAFPPGGHAASFVAAVERADRAWRAACDAAERIRLSNLTPAERTAVERVIKLLTTARDSDSDAERLAAYARARSELAKLDRAGVISMPRTAQAALEAAGRGRLSA